MTVNAELPRVQHVTDGIQVNFPFNFRVLEEDDVEVFLNGNQTPENPASFTVALTPGPPVGNDGGSVTMLVAPGPGTLTVARLTDRTQDTDYVAFDAFPAETHETGLDKAMMVAQEYADTLSRVFLAAPGYDPTTLLTVPDYESGKLLQWSVDPDDGLPHRLINSTLDLTTLTAAVLLAQAAAAAAAVSAAAALASEGNAATSEANAAASEGNAATSETNAAASAAAAAISAAAAAFFDVSVFDAAPTALGVVRHVMTRSATYDFDGIAGTGFTDIDPSVNTVFTVNKELLAGGTTALATMTFSNGSNDGVWADVAGGDVTLAAGDRVEIVGPAALNGIGGVAITVPLLLP